MNKNNIVLVGFMGTGKSTVGKALAERLNWTFVDVDREIEAVEGKSIPVLFREKGEEYFRQSEQEQIARVMQGSRQIVSMGGGAVLREANRRAMAASGLVVALTASASTILERVKNDPDRPLLAGNPEQKIAQLLKERKNAYQFADIHINTDELQVTEVVEAILSFPSG
ncbi:shikimate kinase [Paenibacillus senegalensis]|uniref:shikimate kinase n=1 Tax=Paenibacillus senegalensis TaxID=1465766 RepID=UPI000289FCDF|nr:shikimate kinase [Paenibacillus senegalensis]